MKIFIPRAGDEIILNQDITVPVQCRENWRYVTRQMDLKKGTILKVNSLDGRRENLNLRLKGLRDLIVIPIGKFNGIDCELNMQKKREIHSLFYPMSTNNSRSRRTATSKLALVTSLRRWGSHRTIFKNEIDPILEKSGIYRPDYTRDRNNYHYLKNLYEEAFDQELRERKGITSWVQILDHLPEGYKYEVKEVDK